MTSLPRATPAAVRRRHRRAALLAATDVTDEQPAPTAAAVYVDEAILIEARQLQYTTVQSTIADSEVGGATKAKIPIGSVVGGVIGGVAIVVLGALLTWWWIANKPKAQPPKKQKQSLPRVGAGVVPPPVSSRTNAKSIKSSGVSIASSTGEKHALGSYPSSSSAPGPQNRSTSASSTTGLLPTLNTTAANAAVSSPPIKSPTRAATRAPRGAAAAGEGGPKQHKPSPLSSNPPISPTTPEPPKWGQMPFHNKTPSASASSAVSSMTISPSNSQSPLHQPTTPDAAYSRVGPSSPYDHDGREDLRQQPYDADAPPFSSYRPLSETQSYGSRAAFLSPGSSPALGPNQRNSGRHSHRQSTQSALSADSQYSDSTNTHGGSGAYPLRRQGAPSGDWGDAYGGSRRTARESEDYYGTSGYDLGGAAEGRVEYGQAYGGGGSSSQPQRRTSQNGYDVDSYYRPNSSAGGGP